MHDDDTPAIRQLRDARVVAQLRPLVQHAIEWTGDELEPAILRALTRQNPRFTPAEAVELAVGLTELAVSKAARELSEFDRGVFRGAVRTRTEGLITMLREGWYPEKIR